MHDHPELREFLDGDAPASKRLDLLRHLQVCGGCRATLAAEDPSRLFALLALEPVPAGLLDRLSVDIAAAVEESDVAPERRGARWGWATIAASLLLAGVFSTYLWNRDGRTVDPGGTPSGALIVEPGRELAFELLSSPGTAQVVDLSVGGTRFVMIFDEDLDL